jgi:5-methylcytosine-specific restriction endonuclease McrA
MTRRPDHIPTRKPFSKAIKAEVLKRSAGMCEAPDCDRVGKHFDHCKPVSIGGESTLSNCRLLCEPCNREKGIQEARDAAKADRAGGRSGQQARRARAKAAGTYKPIASKGFQGSRRFDGSINWRGKSPPDK